MVQEELFKMQDVSYRDFHKKLIPTVAEDKIIGVRTPELRKFAKQFSKSGQADAFMADLPHTYYEENNLHAFLIEQIKDYDACIAALNKFLPFMDNWATCDMCRPKVFQKHLPELEQQIRVWLDSGDTYTIRFGIGMLLTYFLDSAFQAKHLEWVLSVHSEEYYIQMMIAWYFATALAKQYDTVLPILENRRLDVWEHNKTIQKAVESYRITPEQKRALRALKIKK